MRRLLWIVFLLSILIPCTALAEFESSAGEDLELFFTPEELYVSSASRIRESFSEAPAIVTIITREQIRKMGARNLLDILVTIPGFFEIQDTNEKVLAGRGIFATTTHKFLLLRDGHRLNDPIFEEIMPANAISLESIQRIEVLRGTGASLYGNASLLGIINIVTLNADRPETRVGASIGNHGTAGVDFTHNASLAGNRQFLFFGSMRDVKGEKLALPASLDMAAHPAAGPHTIDGRPFNYDVGIKYATDASMFALSVRRAAYDTPRSNDGAFLSPQDTLVNPIQVFDFKHLDFRFTPTWKDIRFTLRHYADQSSLFTPQYLHTARDGWGRPCLRFGCRRRPAAGGKAFSLSLESARAGIEYSGQLNHRHGSLVAGLQFENFWLLNSAIEANFGNQAQLTRFPPLRKISEWNSALYVQEKYRITANFLINAGMRWDYYQSFGSSFSPRVALIFAPWQNLTIKAIYGRAFQAPSYFYRTENLGLGYGSPHGLRPETLDNLQLSIEHVANDHFWLRISGYRNRIRDLISRPVFSPFYLNLGSITIQGIETEAKMRFNGAIEAFLSHSWQQPVKSKTDAQVLIQGNLANIPKHTIATGISWTGTHGFSGSIYANWHGRIFSPRISPIPGRSNRLNTIAPATIVNATLSIDHLIGNWFASLSAHNLFNVRDWRGGTTKTPYPQEGRSFLLSLGIDL